MDESVWALLLGRNFGAYAHLHLKVGTKKRK